MKKLLTTSNALIVVMTVCTLGAFCFATIRRDYRVAAATKHANGEPTSSMKTPSNADEEENKAFWLTIRPSGFEVKEMTVSAGNYFVVVQNATGLDQFSLRVERENGPRMIDFRSNRFKKHWKQMIHLVPGRYFISETDHPEWNCVVTVN